MSQIRSIAVSHICHFDYKTRKIFSNRDVTEVALDYSAENSYFLASFIDENGSEIQKKYDVAEYFEVIYDIINLQSIHIFGKLQKSYYNNIICTAYPQKCFSDNIDVSRESMRIVSARASLLDICKASRKVGVLIDFVNDNNRHVLQSLKAFFSPEIQFYYFSIGTIEDYKLGNFPDIDLFISFKCNICFDSSRKYIKPIVTPYEFLASQLDCFWNFRYGDIMGLLKNYSAELLRKTQVRGYLTSDVSSFHQVFSCPSADSNERSDRELNISAGSTGLPMSYTTFS